MGKLDRLYIIAFNMVQGIGGLRLRALAEHFGGLDKAWEANLKDLRQTPGIGEKIAQQLLTQREKVDPVREEEWARKQGGRIVTIVDQNYPQELRSLAVPPPVLYIVGHAPRKHCIGVVGTRRPSPAGQRQAWVFSQEFARRGFAVVSGLARGIDKQAHLAALRAGGETVAVLGSHIGSIYPAEHRGLAEQIAKQGALVSEFASTHPTVPGNFPRRNRIIAGLSQRLLVVEASLKSGALNTADWAAECGKDVWAIPGAIADPLREGTNRLIQQGAGLAADPSDVLLGLDEVSEASGEHLDELAKLYHRGASPDEISALLRIPISHVLARLTDLELASKDRG